MRILIMEPDEYYHPHFAEWLGSLGEVIIRTRAAGIREFVEQTRPDAMIMELLLPDDHGYHVLEEIQEFRVKHDLPVIIFSRVDHLEDIKQLVNSGITAYFVKGQDTINDVKKLLLTL